jgi:hypothetical protein
MSDGEAGRMTDPRAAGSDSKYVFWPKQSTPSSNSCTDIAVEVRGVQDEQGSRLDQVRVGRWTLGSMMVVACLCRTTGCAAYGQSANVVFYLGESGAAPIRPLQPSISAPPVILQSTHEAALDVVDLKRRALELS